MKKWMTGIVLSIGILGFSTNAFATAASDSTQTISGTGENGTSTTGDIIVNGNFNVDNTDPEAEIPEGDQNWVNVTVPSVTNFWNQAGTLDITSNDYTITNNSGRSVKVEAVGFNQTGGDAMPGNSTLQLDSKRNDGASTSTTDLIGTNGSALGTLNNSLGWLANSEGKLSAGDAAPNANKQTFTYQYTGTLSEAFKGIDPVYNLTLRFTVPTGDEWNQGTGIN